MAKLEILLTGVTGYIGGTVLSTLSKSEHRVFKECHFSVLVRRAENAEALAKKGLKPVLFEGLENTDQVEKISRQYDIIINTTPGFSVSSARAMVFGLGARRKQIGHNVYYIHTSGTSNVANQPITDKYDDSHVLSDIDNIYSFEKSRESSEPYPQRTADIAVVEAGLGLNVNTYIMMPPTIYGRGTGDFNKQTIQVPTIIRSALKTGQVEVVGNGSGIAGHVHVEDLALLYGTVLDQLLGGENIPHGKKGIYFAATGHHTWTELSQGIADALYQLGAIKTKEVKSIGLTEAAEKWAGGNELVTELNFAASYRTKPDLGGILGWKPQRTDEDFQHHYLDEVKLICSQEGKS